jgi:hypothetical protein
VGAGAGVDVWRRDSSLVRAKIFKLQIFQHISLSLY